MPRPRRASRRRRRTSVQPSAAVPFVLAAPRTASIPGGGEQRRIASLVRLWDQLAPLESSAWAGKLTARRLLRLQRLRVAYASLFHEAGG